MKFLEIFVGLLSAAFATLAFAIMFRVRKKHLPVSALGGLLVYAVYLIVGHFASGEFLPCLVGAFVIAIYSEGCARFLRAPVQIYMIPELVPLFPGGALYYSMFYLLSKDYVLFSEYLIMTLETALGLAGGVIVGIAVFETVVSFIKKHGKERPFSDE